MKRVLRHFLKILSKPFHRFYLWTRPAYLRHRTPSQKSFDIRIQYTFLGCLIGLIAVGIFVYIKKPSRIENVFLSGETFVQEEHSQNDIVSSEKVVSKEEIDQKEEITPMIAETSKKVNSTELILEKKETLLGLLKRANVPYAQGLEAAKALEIVFDIRKIRQGQLFEVFFIENEFQGIKLENSKGETFSVFKNKSGEFIPKAKEGIIENKRFVLTGSLENTFSESAQKAGVSKNVIHQVVLALDGKIDFKKDLKPNAPFKIVYEQKMTDTGKAVGKSQLLYISLITHTATVQRYFFIDAMGVKGYYDENGESTPQTLLKRPLGSGRISSPFGMRLHPILGYRIQHKGIDFPAKIGTPIPAAADGVVQRLGRNGGYGKFIQIKHNSTYTTAYGHLNSYQSELRVGSYVKKGEIIGYVGNTGRSTGPHLHYEVLKNKEPVNPLKTYIIPQRVLKNQSLAQFKKKKEMIDALKPTHLEAETGPAFLSEAPAETP